MNGALVERVIGSIYHLPVECQPIYMHQAVFCYGKTFPCGSRGKDYNMSSTESKSDSKQTSDTFDEAHVLFYQRDQAIYERVNSCSLEYMAPE